jgi:hypothetical protein
MGGLSILEHIKWWIYAIPTRIAYRIIWLGVKLGSPISKNVYDVMWNVNLNLPELKNESNIK